MNTKSLTEKEAKNLLKELIDEDMGLEQIAEGPEAFDQYSRYSKDRMN
jgi:hypothetical protein